MDPTEPPRPLTVGILRGADLSDDHAGLNAMELMLVIGVLSIAVVSAIRYYEVAIYKAQFTETLSLAIDVRNRVTGYRADMGTWPDAEQTQALAGWESRGFPMLIGGEDGSFSLRTLFWRDEIDDPLVTFRPTVDPDESGAPVIWICGRGAVPEGRIVLGEDLTNIPDRYLPHQCSTGGRL